ncbi:MAG: hypothetical protein A2X36_01970 [Elusimicrobia bacterium GWA2_69_24]|nr:MAG: hypothetical protein A2X36_01970 [Elusimicrobia bacterium GWA2_69_24]HBL16502.1 hypothetical protein [Elusimicrobiota bacterium]
MLAGKILIVDNNTAFASQLKLMLEKAGITVLVRADPVGGNTALNSFKPDIMVLEMDLAAGGGRNLYRMARANEQLADLPIIILSSSNTNPQIWEALEAPSHPKTLVLRRSPNLRLLLPVAQKLLAAKYGAGK